MELTVQAGRVMNALAARFGTADFANRRPWPVGEDEIGDTFEELARLGLLAQDGGAGSPCHLTDAGRSWILGHRALVVVFCPKCSTDEYVPKGHSQAQARCHVCGVGWTEDTTAEPFVPRY